MAHMPRSTEWAPSVGRPPIPKIEHRVHFYRSSRTEPKRGNAIHPAEGAPIGASSRRAIRRVSSPAAEFLRAPAYVKVSYGFQGTRESRLLNSRQDIH